MKHAAKRAAHHIAHGPSNQHDVPLGYSEILIVVVFSARQANGDDDRLVHFGQLPDDENEVGELCRFCAGHFDGVQDMGVLGSLEGNVFWLSKAFDAERATLLSYNGYDITILKQAGVGRLRAELSQIDGCLFRWIDGIGFRVFCQRGKLYVAIRSVVGVGRASFSDRDSAVVAMHDFDFRAGGIAKAASRSKHGRQVNASV